MKNLILAFVLIFTSICVNAQDFPPRFGTKPSEDNTGRVLNYDYKIVNDVAGYDTIRLKPNAFLTIYQVNVIDSCNFAIFNSDRQKSRMGDEIIIMGRAATNAGYARNIHFSQIISPLNFLLTKDVSDPLTLTNLRGFIRFVFDGIAWYEQYRIEY